MTKHRKKRLKRKYKLAQIAIAVCDRVLGPIERDQTTLDALEVARVMSESERLDHIYAKLAGEFEERCFDLEELIPRGLDEEVEQAAGDAVRELCWDAWQIGWDEVRRRENYGQDVERNLEHLCYELISNMAT